jgi:hypothetical protein
MSDITTKNTLLDFDMCLAVAQSAINEQMENAWVVWAKKRGFADTIKIFKVRDEGQLVDSKFGLNAKIAPLAVSLNVEDGKLGQVQVTLTLLSGTVSYYDEVRGGERSVPISNWSVSFITNLDKKPARTPEGAIDWTTLEKIDPQAYGTARDVIKNSNLPEGVFSIEYLFLKLTEIDLMLVDNKSVQIPSTVPSGARNKALDMLNLLLNGELGEFVLGTVVRRNSKEATPTFALTDFVFDVRPNSVPSAATLNYLGMFSSRPLPSDLNGARIKLSDAWVRPEQLDGTEAMVAGVMAFSSGSYLETYLIPKFRTALKDVEWTAVLGTAGISHTLDYAGPTPTRQGLTWTFGQKIETGNIWPDPIIGQLELKLLQQYRLDVAVQPSAAAKQVTISGRVDVQVHLEGSNPITGRTQWIHVEGHQDFSGSIELTGSGIGTDFTMGAKLTHSASPRVVDKSEVGGLNTLQITSELTKLLGITDLTAEELFRQAQEKSTEALLGTLESALGRVDMDLSQHAFIPPGGGVFTFRNPRFASSGDLFLEVIYRLV